MNDPTRNHATARESAARAPLPFPHPDALLTREAAADALTARGLVISKATLATLATRGGGPPFALFNRRALYRWQDALAWAEGRMSPPRRSTSEADARAA